MQDFNREISEQQCYEWLTSYLKQRRPKGSAMTFKILKKKKEKVSEYINIQQNYRSEIKMK